MEFSQLLKDMLAAEGITQQELAERCQMTPTSILRYVNGIRIPSWNTAMKIIETFTRTNLIVWVGDVAGPVEPGFIERMKAPKDHFTMS